MKRRRAELAHVPLAQRRLDLTVLVAQGLDSVSGGCQPLFSQGILLDGLEVLERELGLAAPGDQGGFGDIEFRHQAHIGPALRAQLNKTWNRGLVVRTILSYPFRSFGMSLVSVAFQKPTNG